ncbi:MAG: hypothetical protein HXM44_06375, partial [Lautropia mirabilis]|nr:hypothetical protein [Lautropia mirabilis]
MTTITERPGDASPVSRPAARRQAAARAGQVRMPTRLSVLAALLVLAGCGSLAPLPKNPDAPVPDQFAHAQPHAAAARTSTALAAAGNPVT